MAQQYGYGYGYQPYAYTQPDTTAGYASYVAPRPPYTPATPPVLPAAQQPAQQSPAQQQGVQQNVGYSPYGTTPVPYNANPSPAYNASSATYNASSTPAHQTHQTQGSGTNTYAQQSSSQPAHHATHPSPAPASYQSYSSYKPQTPAYTPYYNKSATTTPATAPATTPALKEVCTATTTTTYVPTYSPASGSSGTGMIGYPSSFPQSSYASSANAYYKQMKETKTNQVGYSSQHSTAANNLTPVQQQVVQQYIHQKHQVPGQTYGRRKSYTQPQNQQSHYCEVCKISCASALTYKTHLDGKIHKKKLTQQKLLSSEEKSNSGFFCELCDVVCSNKDGLEAHMRGAKHMKVVNLYRKMGKPIPTQQMPSDSSSKTVMVTAPRISFVGGKQLNSTGTGFKEANVKVYPSPAPKTSSAAASTSTENATNATPNNATPNNATPKNVTPTTATSNNATPTNNNNGNSKLEEQEPEPVGEHLVVPVSNDSKFPHASFKCNMCDCYFNDEFATKAHIKGRRHRLNYKKTYDSTIYVEPTKSMKRELERKRKQRETMKSDLHPMRGRGGMERGGRGGRYWNAGGDFSSGVSHNEMHRQETLELARMEQMMHREEEGYGYEEFYPPGPAPPPMLPYLPRNPHDDKLVLNKHNSIYPNEAELKAVDGVVRDVEKVLKIISDDMLAQSIDTTSSAPKDESKRVLKGVMRVGAFARGLLLKGECSVELVLMTTTKPNMTLFNALSSRMPAKFEELKASGVLENIYNVTPDANKAVFAIISQVDEHRIKVSLTLTSTAMREEPSVEQAKTDAEEGVLDRPSCLAALAALRHTKWFQAMAHDLPSCIIIMRVLKDICRRVPAWGVLDTWVLQLLVQKCIVSANSDFTKPGDVFRRVMESVASGLFLPGGAGLCDPCEKGAEDASAVLTAQERANITLSAQHALRLIAFDKLHLVLGVDPLTSGSRTQEEEELPGEEEEGGAFSGTKRDAESSESADDNCKKMKLEQ